MSRIVVVTTTFPQWEGDPRGAFIRRHWELRCERGDEVVVLAPRTRWCTDDLASPLVVKRITYAPARLSTLTGRFGILENIRERPWRACLVPLLWRALRRSLVAELEAEGADLVVGHMMLPAGWIVARACAPARIPFELYGHGTDVDVLMRLPAPLRRRFAAEVRAARVIHFPSVDKRARFRRALGLHVDPAPLEVESMLHAVPSPPAGLSLARGRDILFLGRLIRQKGVDDLLRAAALIAPMPVVHVAGDGPERRRLERLAHRLGVPARFHGFVTGEAKDALLRRCGVLCVPSKDLSSGLSEGAPLVIAEASRYGLPVVATAVGGIPELGQVLDAIVHLVPPASTQALAVALREVLDRRGELGEARPSTQRAAGL